MKERYYKRMYSVREFYTFLQEALRTMKYMNKAKKSKAIDNQGIERIMLAVTEVNGCELCSYMHTKDALKHGMSQEEINQMLSGESNQIPVDESVAIFFAQHYAESKGKPSKEAWQRLLETYGEEKALGILGAVRAIMMGNTHGIAMSALLSRLKGKRIKKSSLGYELKMTLSIIPFLPMALVHSFLLNRTKASLLDFSE